MTQDHNRNYQIIDQSGDSRYLLILPAALDDLDISPGAMRVYIHLERVGVCRATDSEIGTRCQMTLSEVQGALRELVAGGLIAIGENKTGRVIRTNNKIW